ncbi:MAG: universal stress protein [Phenylobacterium sp.]|uniref:universal stress protein n=1 Tax=Phenylobacterium sp. TaxID=1871053 RepID=UPI002718EA11|nr:universal stress protein [Phenylobacterium sp.]MDO8900465.1 universal stress protein [Phenylobacterium sp.]MDP2212464.1 universal stress protein [Phenylobacterium sp.]
MSGSAKNVELVCGIDGSPHAAIAIDLACRLSKGLGLGLCLIAVNRLRSAGGYPDLRDWSEVEARAILRGAEDQARRSGAAPRLMLAEGRDVAKALLTAAEEVGARHIVVGTGDPKGLGRLLMGSVATAVAEQAHVSVTIARGP